MINSALITILFFSTSFLFTAKAATVTGDKNQIEVQAEISDVHEIRLYGEGLSITSENGSFYFADSLQDGAYKYKVFIKKLVNNKPVRSFSDNGRTPEMRPSSMAISVAENGSFYVRNGVVLGSPSAASSASQETLDSDGEALLESQMLHNDDPFQTPPVKNPPVIKLPVENLIVEMQSPAKAELVNPFEVNKVSSAKTKKTPWEQDK